MMSTSALKAVLSIVVLLIVAAAAAEGSVLLRFELNGYTNSDTLSAGDTPNTTDGPDTALLRTGGGLNTFTMGPGVAPTNYNNFYSSRFNPQPYSGDLAAALTNGAYQAISVQAKPGEMLSLSELRFRTRFHGNDSNDPGFALFTSATGFNTGDQIYTDQYSTTFGWNGPEAIVDLSSISELQGVSDPVEFRLYFHGLQSSYMQFGWPNHYYEADDFGSDDWRLEGTASPSPDASAIPEPVTAGLLLLGTLSMWARRRR